MRAFVLDAFDEPPRFRDMPRPQPGASELLIRVLSTSVNPVDAMVADGFFRSVQQYRFPAVLGRDLCGVVEQVGSAVTDYEVGDRVFGFIKRQHIGNGTFAEYVTSPADYFVARAPAGVPDVEAGAFGLSGITAQECLDVLALDPGRTVLINGATGGVGSFAVQIAVDRGLRVIATARPGTAADFVLSLGAHEAVDWTADLIASVRHLAPDGVDGLVDLVRRDTSTVIGQDETQAQLAFAEFARGVVRAGGAVVSLTNGVNSDFIGDLVGTNVHSSPTVDAVARLADAAERGAVRASLAAVYAFDDIAEAFERQRAGARGKVAVSLSAASAGIGLADSNHSPEPGSASS